MTFAKDGYVTRSDTSVLVADQVTARHSVCQSTTDCATPLVCCSIQGAMVCLDQTTCSQLNP